jgi:Ca2+-binding EF-hand superfamily protein
MADRDLTEEEVADLKEAFAMFDINGDGRLQLSNLGCSSPAVYQ